MSNKQGTKTHISERALKVFGPEGCQAALEVIREMRDGTIKPEEYDQDRWCGTACCLGGHIYYKLFTKKRLEPDITSWVMPKVNSDLAVTRLFALRVVKPTLEQGADALEKFICEGAEYPWGW